MSNDVSGFLNTRRAADYLGLSHRTLDGYRVSGAGPAFHRFGNRVRYRRSDLDAWAAKRRATTTAEADRLSPTSPTQREFCRFSLFSATQVIELLNPCTPNSPKFACSADLPY